MGGQMSHFSHGTGGMGTREYIFFLQTMHHSSFAPESTWGNVYSGVGNPKVLIGQVWHGPRYWHFKQAPHADWEGRATL